MSATDEKKTEKKPDTKPAKTPKNLEVWDFLGTTDPNFTKPITGKRFNGTSINATYCYRKMTEQFGLCGVGWKYEVTERNIHNGPEGQMLLFVDVAVFVLDDDSEDGWSAPIPGVGGNPIFVMEGQGEKRRLFMDDEAYKKATTDALTNAMKFLGMSADVHTGLYDDSKYINSVKQEFGEGKFKDDPPPTPPAQKPPHSPVFNSPEEIADWDKATVEKTMEYAKLASNRRTEWMKKAAEHLLTLTAGESVVRWKSANIKYIDGLPPKSREAMELKITERLQALQAPKTEVVEDEIPF